jgi:hypothetical protein
MSDTLKYIEPIEYRIQLNTKEIIKITELNVEIIEELRIPEIVLAADYALKFCSRMSRDAVEEAKMGHSKRFEELIRISPNGALIKFESPICRMIGECAMADLSVCTTKNIEKVGRFPVCWEFQYSQETSEDIAHRASLLVFVIVHAWRQGRYVILIND